MKALTKIAVKCMLVILPAVFAARAGAQDTKENKNAAKQQVIKDLVAAQNYVFKAQSAQPLGGGNRQLTTDYDLRITKEKITSYLPFFGRAFSAPLPSQGGINFTSTSFDYTLTDRRKGGWSVLIKPKDAPEVQQLSLTISEDGYASLQVISTNRSAISYSGYITEIKEKKK